MSDARGETTLAGVLLARAEAHPGRTAYVFLTDGDEDEQRLDYGGLGAWASAVAAWLREAGAVRERVLLVLPTGLEYLAAFYGCLLAGAIAVPVYPPRRSRSPERLATILADCAPRVCLTSAALLPRLREELGAFPNAAAMQWQAVEELPRTAGSAGALPTADDIAFLQYTSGSLASPKGVIVRHGNLMANQQMIREGFRHGEDSHVASWLPLYHDMGLIGNVMQPLYNGAACVLMAPEAFLMRPVRWLRAISRHRCRTSGGPNFAYELCARKIRPEQCEGLDLSSWTLAYNGAEPVRPGAMERFARRFAEHGFDRAALRPCYGLAEATLMVTIAPPRPEPRLLCAEPASLEQHRFVPATADGAGRWLASCGPAWGGEVRIADPESGAPCPPGHTGEVRVRGPHVADGYWNRAEETAAAFVEETDGRWLRTGDLGFLHDGELFVTGRIKDLVIIGGRNHYPADLELTAERSHPSIRQGGCCAFAVEGKSGEELVMLAELERTALRDGNTGEIERAAQRCFAEEHDVRVAHFSFLRPGALPRTSSGKLRRLACRKAWLAGEMEQVTEAE